MQILGYVRPAFFLLFVLMLPLNTSAALRLVLAFVMGLSVDVFSQSMGMHTAAVVAMAYVQHYLIPRMKVSKDIDESKVVSLKIFDFQWFAIYSFVLILVYHLAFFALDAFSFHYIWRHLYIVPINSLASFIVIMAVQLIAYKK